MTAPLRIRTRGSALALWQANWVKAQCEERLQRPVELVIIKTEGDQRQDVPLSTLGGRGVFVKEIETALLGGRIDVAVHSAKDLPSDETPGTTLAAFPQRADARDALLVRADIEAEDVADLPQGARVGTGSLRRRCQLLSVRPDLEMLDLRGNVDTRIRKLEEGQYEAIILACAGLARLGLGDKVRRKIDTDLLVPAVCQGILAVQTRDESLAADVQGALDDPAVRLMASAERSFLAAFQGGCQIPVGAHATLEGGVLQLRARITSLDGSEVVETRQQVPLAQGDAGVTAAQALGRAVSEKVLADGGAAILESVYGSDT
jgi:hydroxymethylbilane synthase